MDNTPCKTARGESAPATVAAADATASPVRPNSTVPLDAPITPPVVTLNAPQEPPPAESSEFGEKRRTTQRVVVPLSERAAYTPSEFAALHGKSPTWGYRQIYAGRVRVITGLGGLMMIPASELKRLQSEAHPLEFRRRPRHFKGSNSKPA